MFPSILTTGLLVDAELAYRRERLVVDVAVSRRLLGRVGRLRRRRQAAPVDLTLAA